MGRSIIKKRQIQVTSIFLILTRFFIHRFTYHRVWYYCKLCGYYVTYRQDDHVVEMLSIITSGIEPGTNTHFLSDPSLKHIVCEWTPCLGLIQETRKLRLAIINRRIFVQTIFSLKKNLSQFSNHVLDHPLLTKKHPNLSYDTVKYLQYFLGTAPSQLNIYRIKEVDKSFHIYWAVHNLRY